MSETASAPRHGRRARRLSPEESEALATRGGLADQTAEMPTTRGAVAAPGADEPRPSLRRFGKRARIIELDELDPRSAASSDAQAGTQPVGDDAVAPPVDAPMQMPAADVREQPVGTPAADGSTSEHAERTDAELAAAADPWTSDIPAVRDEPAPAARTTVVDRDADGVELGEMSVTEAPDPRPAPRFEGQVLHRPEKTTSRSLLWIVWVLVTLAVLALVILLATGVIGPDRAAAFSHELPGVIHAAAVPRL